MLVIKKTYFNVKNSLSGNNLKFLALIYVQRICKSRNRDALASNGLNYHTYLCNI